MDTYTLASSAVVFLDRHLPLALASPKLSTLSTSFSIMVPSSLIHRDTTCSTINSSCRDVKLGVSRGYRARYGMRNRRRYFQHG